MLCGYFPFEHPNLNVMFRKIETAEIRYPKYISETAKDLLNHIFVVDPSNRYNVQDVLNHPFCHCFDDSITNDDMAPSDSSYHSTTVSIEEIVEQVPYNFGDADI
eukprot:PhF_6_TR32189/c2_g1_i4/m.47817